MTDLALCDAPPSMAALLSRLGGSDPDRRPRAVVWCAGEPPSDWEGVRDRLDAAFAACRRVAQGGGAVVAVVHEDDLLGARGAAPAMLACALLSGMRTLALEGLRSGAVANTLAVDDDTAAAVIEEAVERALTRPRPSGELVRLGLRHLGRSAP